MEQGFGVVENTQAELVPRVNQIQGSRFRSQKPDEQSDSAMDMYVICHNPSEDKPGKRIRNQESLDPPG